MATCRHCKGTGVATVTTKHTIEQRECTYCKGTGSLTVTTCQRCSGDGRFFLDLCHACAGRGAYTLNSVGVFNQVIPETFPCSHCGGSGSKWEICSACKGEGEILIPG